MRRIYSGEYPITVISFKLDGLILGCGRNSAELMHYVFSNQAILLENCPLGMKVSILLHFQPKDELSCIVQACWVKHNNPTCWVKITQRWVRPFLTQRWVAKITQIGLFLTQQFLECTHALLRKTSWLLPQWWRLRCLEKSLKNETQQTSIFFLSISVQ